MRITALLLVLIPFVAHADVGKPEPLSQFPQSVVTLATPDARVHRFKIWIADTEARREQGLMFIEHLDEDTGMLFVYPSARRIAMWMKNTYISLDMLFIRGDGRVTRVVKRAKPESLDIIDSNNEVSGVLEINGGIAEKFGIVAGAVLTRADQSTSGAR
jgi:uncharacterized membrane protein (UPF0127 family)